MPDTLRLFVACELPAALLEAIARVQADLKKRTEMRLRWVRPEGIHLTLKFLGDVEPSHANDIQMALAREIEPFELTLRPNKLGGFGGNRVRVVWLGLDGDLEELERLAGTVDEAMADAGFEREGRPFRAHLTLARVPDRAGNRERRALAELVEGCELPEMPEVKVSQVALIRSILGQGGARYETLARFPA